MTDLLSKSFTDRIASSSLQPKQRLVYWLFPPFLAIILYSIYVIATNFSEPENFSWSFLMMSVLLFYSYLFFMLTADRLLSKTKLSVKPGIKAVMVFLLALIASLIFSMVIYYALKSAFIQIYQQNDRIGRYHLILRGLNTVVGFVIVYSVYLSINFYNQALKKRLVEEQYEREQLELRYELLYNKMDPHFLFNNLNTLHTLISESNPLAEAFVLSLSRIMRYSFRTQGEDLVAIQEELKVLEDYVLIMKNRFGAALVYTLGNAEAAKVKVLPMTLLNLMENAVKHNEISQEKPLRIHLEISDKTVRFTNNIHPRINPAPTGSGLTHLREIYHLKFGKTVTIQQDESFFTVTIPSLQR